VPCGPSKMALGPHFFSGCFRTCVLTLGAHSADDACSRDRTLPSRTRHRAHFVECRAIDAATFIARRGSRCRARSTCTANQRVKVDRA
jgi:hypothetical protein